MYNIYRYIKSILYNIIVYGEMRMKKKFIIPLSVAAMTLVSVTAVSAAQEPAVQPQYGVVSDYEMVGASESATYGQFKYSVNSKNEAIIEGLSDEAAAQSDVHLIIPAKINGYNVTEIENSAFKDNVNIKSVTFSEGLKKIGGAAFSGCVNLTGTVTLPSTLTSINYDWGNNGGAFSGTSISKVVFKDGTDKLTVDRYAFSSCKSLTEVSLPSNISNVGPYTFDGDSSLEKVTFKDGSYELTISDNAFRKTAVKNVTFPKNTIEIGAGAFDSVVELTSITLNEGLKTIGSGAFEGCNNLSGKLVIPSTVETIGSSYYEGAFERTSITSVEFKDSSTGTLLSIYDNTFKDCKMLESVSLPNRVKNIASRAFANDTNLSSVEFKEVPANLTIGDSAFYNTAIKEVKLPSKTTSLGSYAFKDCASLEMLELNEGLTSIGQGAFSNCTSLGGVINIPSTVTTIGTNYGDGVFDNTDIFGVVIADGNAGISIGYNAFGDCKKLAYADLSNRVTGIYGRAFQNDTALQWVKIKKDNYDVTMASDAFLNATALEKISIPKRTKMNGDVFNGCTALKNIYYSGSEKDYSNYVTISFDYGNNKEYQNATLTYNYTAYDTWAVPKEPDKSLNGLAQDENGVWKNYKDGKVDTEYTGLVDYNGTWIYVEAGEVNWGYTGLVDYNGMWFYVSGGVIDWNYEGIADYAGNWFYVTGGMINWDYTGLTCYSGAWFYVSGGVLDWSYTGLAYYNGIWFYVSGGMVDWSYSGLVYYNGAWFAVSGGTINWSTTLVEYNGMWFYVSGGMVDWDYTGTYVFYGNTFNIVGGVVVW
jgi:hypothetical protein